MAQIAASPLLCSASAPAWAAPWDAWDAWKSRFLGDDGRVVDDGGMGISHSEGQGYGLLLAQAFGDRNAFEAIEAWTTRHLLIRQETLMAWRWELERGVTDWRTATDGDLFRAWALLRASRDSGWDAASAEPIARDIAALCVAPDPRAPGEPLLLPGAESRRDGLRVTVNPSYIMGRALRELGEAAQSPILVRAADHGETVLGELAAAGFVPDWIDVTTSGFAAPADHDLRAGYDALRVPLYLVWSGRRDHPAVARGVEALMPSDDATGIAVTRDAGGIVTEHSDLPGYRALLSLAACADVSVAPQEMNSQPYYPATLHLLALIAKREGASC
ncbi:glycosyl hydrolase family 8 [Thetidibacter halocola]|uniref:cellulase n=1 Tax=Thetidibacter halocola TaxID=2827239 RepID=A0A8J7WF58_9RHOB|nr:glycosyl hydrolase family 8 [Thetidibacter halocola]MBS0126532.1 glycosyl hydrolase family 5 [Thetidibacter halocola]